PHTNQTHRIEYTTQLTPAFREEPLIHPAASDTFGDVKPDAHGCLQDCTPLIHTFFIMPAAANRESTLLPNRHLVV
ncbi:MAG: hypothetical protein O2820_22670, partial [Planctomycetota bacterium]|nr:hypothetical protein [Planctomycetota bacterium]MDA1252022.1 hypothetical protein [Planctomycetota bacterium]